MGIRNINKIYEENDIIIKIGQTIFNKTITYLILFHLFLIITTMSNKKFDKKLQIF